MHRSGPLPLTLEGQELGFGGKNCQNVSQGEKPCICVPIVAEHQKLIPDSLRLKMVIINCIFASFDCMQMNQVIWSKTRHQLFGEFQFLCVFFTHSKRSNSNKTCFHCHGIIIRIRAGRGAFSLSRENQIQ